MNLKGFLLNTVNTRWIIVVPFIVFVFLSVSLALTKMPWVDEAWFASSSVNLAQHGFLGNTILTDGDWAGLAQYTYWQPPMFFLIEGLVFKIFGSGLIQARLLNVFWGLIALFAFYFLAKKFLSQKWAIGLAMFLLSADFYFISGSADGRMDIMAVALMLIAYDFYLYLRLKRLSWAIFSSAMAIVLSGLTHPNGIIGLAGWLFLIIYFDRAKISIKLILLAILPFLLGAIGWAAYILQNWPIFQAQFFGNIAYWQKWSAWPIKWPIVNEVFYRYFYGYGLLPSQQGHLEMLKILILLGLGGLFIFSCTKIKYIKARGWLAILILLIIHVLVLMFLISNKTPIYLIYVTPLLILNAVLVIGLLSRRPKLLMTLLLLGLGTISLVGLLIKGPTRNDYYNKYLADLSFFQKNYYHQGATICGSSELAFFYNFNASIFNDNRRLGFDVNKKFDYLIIGDSYRAWLENFQNKEPATYQYIQNILSKEYHLIYQGKSYAFYQKI